VESKLKFVVIELLFLIFSFTKVFAITYSQEWSGDGVGHLWHDIDSDSINELLICPSAGGGYRKYYNGGTYTLEWDIPLGTDNNVYVVMPRDVNGDGRIEPVDIDGDGENEVVVFRTYTGGGRIIVYNAQTHAEEWNSGDIANLSSVTGVEDIDDDGKYEIIYYTSVDSTYTTYVIDGLTKSQEWSGDGGH